MKVKNGIFYVIILFTAFGCCKQNCSDQSEQCCSADSNQSLYQKKYTNKDFYKDGVFQAEVALEAYKDMMKYYGVPFTKFLEENMWISDFNQGDFENVGMAGVFWVNNPVGGYVGHTIYLLPGQQIVEHRHMKTTFPAKIESWHIDHGSCYNFGIGEATPNSPALAESQKKYTTISHYIYMQEGDTATIAAPESAHFLRAGDNGSIIAESGNYHDGAGLRFSNPSVQFIDALADRKTKKISLNK